MSNKAEVSNRILTIPNVISIARLCLIPIFVIALFGLDNHALAAVLLAILGISDGIDGYIARHFNQVSRLGKRIDPIADRTLFIVVFVCGLIDGSIPRWIILVSALREIAVFLTIAYAAKRHHLFYVNWAGKAYTFGLMIAFPAFIGSHSSVSFNEGLRVLGYIMAIPSLILGWISFAAYVREVRNANLQSTETPSPTSV